MFCGVYGVYGVSSIHGTLGGIARRSASVQATTRYDGSWYCFRPKSATIVKVTFPMHVHDDDSNKV